VILPDSVVWHVESGAKGEALVAVNRIGGTPENPTLVIIVNGAGAVGLTGIIVHAVKTAPTPADKEAWKSLGHSITAAIIGAIGPLE